MRAKTNFYASTMETLRRELVGYSAVISNVVNVAQQQRMEIAAIARYLMATPDVSKQPTSLQTNVATDPGAEQATTNSSNSTSQDQPNSAATLQTTTEAASTAVTNPVGTFQDAISLNESSALLQAPTELAKILVQYIGAYKCKCQKCAPAYYEELEGRVMEEAQAWEVRIEEIRQVQEKWKIEERKRISDVVRKESEDKLRKALEVLN